VAHFFRRQLFAQAGHVAEVPGHRADKSGRCLGIPPAQVHELAGGKEKEGEILHSSAPPLRDGAALSRSAVAFGAGQMYAAGRRRNPKWKFPIRTD
jgi:hypothetical protein